MRAAGVTVHPLRWGDGFPHPTIDDLDTAAADLAAIPDNMTVIIDGLAYGAIPALAEQHADRLKLVALVHHPLALETGLDRHDRQRLARSERRALAAAHGVIVTSPATADTLARDYAVPRHLLTVALPGIDPVEPGPLRPRHPDGVTRLLAVGAASPRKGYDILVDALSALRQPSWHCRIIGSLEQDPATVAGLRAQIGRLGLAGHIELAGTLSFAALQQAYRQADVFVAASHYEGYGMAIAEALQHGLAVIATDGCAVATEMPEGSLLLVPRNDTAALTDALDRLLGDPPLRHRLGQGATATAASFPDWKTTAAYVLQALTRL